MIARVERLFTPEEYLTIERQSDFKSEYICGKIYAMTGASRSHSLLTANISGEFYTQLKASPCITHSSDMRVRAGVTSLYTYPDVTVTCGEEQYVDDRGDVLLNPTVVVEVLSPSTEAYDRGEKAEYYRQVDSLMDYLLVSQDRYRVEQCTRQGENRWILSEYMSLESEVVLKSIGCTLRLADIYAKVALSVASGTDA